MEILPLLILTAFSATAAEVPGWKLVWSDEFDKPGQPDPAKWGYENGLVRNNDKPFYLILNLAIGGAWGGQKGIDTAAFPQRMEVDYVRVYQLGEE